MKDHTAAARKARQRLRQDASGMKRVEELVPEDRERDLREYAAELRGTQKKADPK